ncbi:hypothetical protein [Cloacibacillus evryensis]|uniref:hypothetical protein n=1 Tax=Cloacibacillus evryensis TaxID=508460 RepID=UPI0012EA02BE|nr:hypothetical protein [Cloacibacillus evryensis]
MIDCESKEAYIIYGVTVPATEGNGRTLAKDIAAQIFIQFQPPLLPLAPHGAAVHYFLI